MINSYDDLKAQRARAHNDLQVAKSRLDEDSRTWQEEVRPLKAVSTVASTMFTNPLVKKSKRGLVGTGVQMGINAVLGKTILKRLPTPLNIIVPHVVQNVALNYTEKNGRDWLIKGLRWIKDITEEKPEPQEARVKALIVVEEPVQTLPAPTDPAEPIEQAHSETRYTQ
jgi:hypothetical protein